MFPQLVYKQAHLDKLSMHVYYNSKKKNKPLLFTSLWYKRLDGLKSNPFNSTFFSQEPLQDFWGYTILSNVYWTLLKFSRLQMLGDRRIKQLDFNMYDPFVLRRHKHKEISVSGLFPSSISEHMPTWAGRASNCIGRGDWERYLFSWEIFEVYGQLKYILRRRCIPWLQYQSPQHKL